MKKLSLQDYREIKSWMYRNARPIELAIWQYHFENGSKEAVLAALSFYQNDDGGFGHALEADCWNPNSSPYTTLRAMKILQEIDFNDKQHPILQGIFKFFESNVYSSENGWYFSIPSNNDYAHAPWWTYNVEANEFEGIGLTAEIVSAIFIFGERNSEIFSRALKLSEILIHKLNTIDNYGEMGVGGYCALLEAIEKSGLTSHFDYKALKDKVKGLVYGSIERDTSKWVYYTRRPTDYINSPESIFYEDNKNIVLE